MIKKYKEYIQEEKLGDDILIKSIDKLTLSYEKQNKYFRKLSNIVTEQDIEDQFLRLKEVLNIEVSITQIVSIDEKYYKVSFDPNIKKVTLPRFWGKYEQTPEYEELLQIKYRIENMFPKVCVIMDRGYDGTPEGTVMSLTIRLRENINEELIFLKKKDKRSISDIISNQEIEDQFLRLTEILHCNISIGYFNSRDKKGSYTEKIKDMAIVDVYYDNNQEDYANPNVTRELWNIKERIEGSFPLTVSIVEIDADYFLIKIKKR